MSLLTVTDRPYNAETRLRALRARETAIEAFYVRNNFALPDLDARSWRLRVRGLVDRECVLTVDDLLALPRVTRRVTLECAGNGRSLLSPPAPGTQWTFGAAGTASFAGTPLRAVLERAGVRPDAVECVFTGADTGEVPGKGTTRFQRSLPVEAALASGPMLAWAMNGRPLEPDHGFPVRLVVPEHYAVASVKWLVGIELVDAPFRGHFQADRYVYRHPGIEDIPVTRMRVRSLITSPEDGADVEPGRRLIEGIAWSGHGAVEKVELSLRIGGPWVRADLAEDSAPGVAVPWRLETRLEPGEHRITVRATDSTGDTQPLASVHNELGYGNNVAHCVRVTAR